jgi:diguanylate cyclase (GGDEF)-like protein/PAS domain S-box-containing protein
VSFYPKLKLFRKSKSIHPSRNGKLTSPTLDFFVEENKKRLDTMAENLEIGIWSMNYETKQMVFASSALEKLTGYRAEAFLSGLIIWSDLVYPTDIENYNHLQAKLSNGEMLNHQYRILTATGEIKWIEDRIFPLLNEVGELIKLDGIVQDISERKLYEEKINFFAYHDYLTELPNRRMLDQRLETAISKSSQETFALFYLDMDRFKFVNDTLGHEIGDKLLCEISSRLLTLSEQGSVFRNDGDEFALIQNNLSGMDPITLGKKLIEEIEKPFYIEGYDIKITTSIGIGIFPDDGETAKELKMNTDAALYRAKEMGKNNAQLFNKSLNIESYKRFTLEADLRKSIQNNQFILHYQPRVNTVSGEIVGAEALIRWNHPKWGMVSPIEFIPLAEETGFINEMSDWVIEQVCKQLHSWKRNGYQLVPVSINLSGKTLMRSDLVYRIKEMLSTYQLSPSLIEIEITEDSLIKNESFALSTIRLLKEMGIAIALDDFGTGYSSIGYLKKFNVDYIKIDRSFIKDLQEDSEDTTIIQSIIILAKGFQLKIVAEGVETEKQWKLLKRLNCHYVQGYLFSKPIPVEQLTSLLSKDRKMFLPFKNSQKEIIHFENRRNYFRYELPFLKQAAMTIKSIKGEKIKIGKTDVSIFNIGQGGLAFTTPLQLPITRDMILHFALNDLGRTIEFDGHIVWKQEAENDYFHYGVQFLASENGESVKRVQSIKTFTANNGEHSSFQNIIIDPVGNILEEQCLSR